MESKAKKQQKGAKVAPRSKGVSAIFVIIGCAIVAYLFFYFVCGDPSRFNEKGLPLDPGDVFATLFKGGFVIPMVITLFLTVIALSVERALALGKASGKGNVAKFVARTKSLLEAGDMKGAKAACDAQGGSVANVLNAALLRYEDVEGLTNLNNDEKASIIQKELDEATTLEMPYLEQNLQVIATISTLGTLFGLLGTVLGMIKSFAALATEGAPDSVALSLGISEALMNTAMGIATGAAAIIAYGYFSTRVSSITNAIDEVGFSIGQTYTKKHK